MGAHDEALRARGGRTLAHDEASALRARLPSVPEALVDFLRRTPVVGAELSLDEDADASGLGVDMKWMAPDEMFAEATEAYPGIAALRLGYVPIGMCLEGSGDPYFYRAADGAVVRVPHDAASEDDDSLDDDAVEVVAPSLDAFVTRAAR